MEEREDIKKLLGGVESQKETHGKERYFYWCVTCVAKQPDKLM